MFNASADPMAGAVLIDTIAGVLILVALLRIWTTPAWMWAKGGWSKLGWAITTLWLTPIYGHIAWPVGAVLALRQIRRLAKRPLPGPPPLPWATGQADQAWWNVDVPVAPAPPASDQTDSGEEPSGPSADATANPVIALWRQSAGGKPTGPYSIGSPGATPPSADGDGDERGESA